MVTVLTIKPPRIGPLASWLWSVQRYERGDGPGRAHRVAIRVTNTKTDGHVALAMEDAGSVCVDWRQDGVAQDLRSVIIPVPNWTSPDQIKHLQRSGHIRNHVIE